jgi:hypothetical protein
LDNGGKIGSFADEKMYEAALRFVNQFPKPYSPNRMIYSIRGFATTNVRGESLGDQHYRVDLWVGSCSYNGPQLLHLPCSHLMIACNTRGLDYENVMYMSPLFWREHTIKIWESSFESYLDPSQWLEYNGPEYVPLPSLKKTRRQKKRLKGDMDACQGRLGADYDFSDFEADADKTEYLCSKCHKEIKNCKCRKKSKGKKTKSTKSTGTNRRKGASNSRVAVEVVC